MRQNIMFRILASVMIFRAIWAFFLFGLMSLFLLGIASSAGVSAAWADLATRITIPQLTVWGFYTFGYLFASYLFLIRREASAWVFGGAMVLDFGLWLYVSAHADYGFEWSGVGKNIDLFLNVLDMVIWILLVYLATNDFFKQADGRAESSMTQKAETDTEDGMFIPVR